MPVTVVISGVYLIKCYSNTKVYIGISKSIYKRWHYHKGRLRRGNHSNIHLQAAWNKYGERAFLFGIIESCPHDQFVEKENKWIHYFDSIKSSKGFNRILSGKVPIYNPLNNTHKLGNSRNKSIVCFNRESSIIKVFKGLQTASRELGIDYKKAQKSKAYWDPASKSKYKKKTIGGWMFIPETHYNPEFDYYSFKLPNKPYQNYVSKTRK